MSPAVLSPKRTSLHIPIYEIVLSELFLYTNALCVGLQHRDCFDPDTETLYDPNGSPYYKTMKHNNNNRSKMSPHRSSPIRQTRSSTNNNNITSNTMTRNRTSSSSSHISKRRAAAAALTTINTNAPRPVIPLKRRRSIKDQIEVQPARSRESSTSTIASSLSSRRSSSSMPPPSSTTPPFNSPLVSSKSLNPKINRRNQAGEISLHRAAAAGKLDDVREFIDRGADVNAQCNAGWTPLHKACLKGYVQIVQLLCENHARTDIRSNDEHDTPLHDACSNGHRDVVEVLLLHGANPRIQNSEGLFPHEMVGDEYPDLRQLVHDATKTFKEAKKDSNDEREDSEPPVSPATKRISRRASTASDVAVQLGNGRPKRGAPSARDDFLARDIHYRDPYRRGHLHLQALQGNAPFVRELLSIGASHSARDRDGNGPLHLAARGGHDEAVKALLEYGADVNALNKKSETPLHEVAGRGHKEIVLTLLFCGADPTLKDDRGRTALDVVIESSSTAAEGELDALKEKFVELGVALPTIPEDMNLKQEDEISEIIEVNEADFPGVSRMEVDDLIAKERASSTPRHSTPFDVQTPPADEMDHQSPPIVDSEDSKSTKAPTPTPAAIDIPSPMDEVIEHEEPVVKSQEAIQEEQPQEMEIDGPEQEQYSPVAVLETLCPPVGKEEPVIQDEVQEPSPELDQPSMPLSEPRETEAMVIESHIEVSEEKPDESLLEQPRQPSIPPPEPQWTKLASLESLPKSLELEISQFLPVYTMQFHNCTTEPQIYVAHTQICSLLGFKTQEFFDKYSHISKRALSNREKYRFCTPFVSLVSYPLTRLPPTELETFMHEEIPQRPPTELDLWHQFDKQRKHQFMTMSVYLVPLDQVREIIALEFPALRDLVNHRSFVRLDTSDLDGDEGVVYSDEEADRYIDCWRRVAGKYASCGL